MKSSFNFQKLLLFSIVILTSSVLTAQNFQYVVNNNPNIHRLRSIDFPNPTIGYAVGDSGTIVKTIDSGNTWVQQTCNINFNFYSVKFVNTNIGWAVGDSGTIRKTTDGGLNWLNQNFGSYYYRSVYFLNTDTGFIAGTNGTFLKTTDGGNNWNIVPINTPFNLNSIFFKSIDTGFVGGILDTILVTTNFGNTWTKIGIHNTGYISSFNFANPNIGFAISSDNSFTTTNGGISWTKQNNNLIWNGMYSLESMHFATSDTGYIVRSLWQTPIMAFIGSEILKTTDGGNFWYSINNIASPNYLLSILFTNSKTGFIVGGDQYHTHGVILKTTGNNLGINNNSSSEKNDIFLYPNPASNEVNIETSQNLNNKKASCVITNAEGEVIFSENLTNNQTKLNINHLSKGFYIIKLRYDSGVLVKKLIKQ